MAGLPDECWLQQLQFHFLCTLFIILDCTLYLTNQVVTFRKSNHVGVSSSLNKEQFLRKVEKLQIQTEPQNRKTGIPSSIGRDLGCCMSGSLEIFFLLVILEMSNNKSTRNCLHNESVEVEQSVVHMWFPLSFISAPYLFTPRMQLLGQHSAS